MKTHSSEPILSEKNIALMRKIDELTRKNKYPPSCRELTQELGYASPSWVVYHVSILDSNGFITRSRRRARTLTLTPKGRRTLESRS